MSDIDQIANDSKDKSKEMKNFQGSSQFNSIQFTTSQGNTVLLIP